MKIECNKCHQYKNEEEFSRKSSKKSGRQGSCKKCHNKQAGEQRETIAYYMRCLWCASFFLATRMKSKCCSVSCNNKHYNANVRPVRLRKNMTAEKVEHLRQVERINDRKAYKRNPEKWKMASRARKHRRRNNKEWFKADDFKNVLDKYKECQLCGSMENLTVDHIYPSKDGNRLSYYNATVLCSSCNSSKGAKKPEEYFGEEKHQEIATKAVCFHLAKCIGDLLNK